MQEQELEEPFQEELEHPSSAPVPLLPGSCSTLAPPPKPKAAAWEKSWQRFGMGQPVDAIAMTQESGKAIQPSTVVSHLFLALQAGTTVTLTLTLTPTPALALALTLVLALALP